MLGVRSKSSVCPSCVERLWSGADDSPAEQTTTKHSGVLACSVYKLRAVSRGPAASRLTAAHSPGTVSSGNFRAASGNRLWLSPSFLTFRARFQWLMLI